MHHKNESKKHVYVLVLFISIAYCYPCDLISSSRYHLSIFRSVHATRLSRWI